MLVIQGQVLLTNARPDLASAFTLAVGTWCVFSSDLAVFFSLSTLTRRVKLRSYIFGIAAITIYCVLIEISRNLIDPGFPLLLLGGMTGGLAVATFITCKSHLSNELKGNLFLKWIYYIEIGMICFGLIRIGSYFAGLPIIPRNPTNISNLMFSLYICMSVFRYFSYLCLRISWVHPEVTRPNLLNKSLVQVIEEKDNLLRGLLVSNKMIGISALASSLAHQLSQPLTGIGLQTETLKRDLLKSNHDPKSMADLDKISKQINKLVVVVSNLRQLFKSRTSQLNQLDLTKVTEELLEIIQPALKEKKIILTKKFIGTPIIYIDSIQIQQVLINLFNNAIDAIEIANPKVREIRLTISSDNVFADISVEDTGAGIDSEVLPTIFELYKSTKENGVGVGLWLAKTIIDKHNGKITAANNDIGGAIFTIRLPVTHGSVK